MFTKQSYCQFGNAAVQIRQSKGLFATTNRFTFIKRKPTMKNIAILVPETAVIEAVADPRYMFTAVNEFIKSGNLPIQCSISWS